MASVIPRFRNNFLSLIIINILLNIYPICGSGICGSKQVVEKIFRQVEASRWDVQYYTKRRFWSKRIDTKSKKVKVTYWTTAPYTVNAHISVCCSGYKHNNKLNTCEPECVPSCVNGYCADVNVCNCLQGYVANPTSISQCVPYCSEPCKNGFCSSPNSCGCHAGFELDADDQNSCIPKCTEKCVNSNCTATDVCTCNRGYVKDHTISHVCTPICSKECKKGHCVAPEQCGCKDGFIIDKDDPSNCVPECIESCVNGYYSDYNICTCYSGYELSTNSSTVCDPVCAENCTNGICTEPNVCTCLSGYENDRKLSNVCNALCGKISCTNGKCTDEKTCICNQGYELYYFDENSNKSASGECIPVCSECENGVCIAPDVCQCDEGYSYNALNNCSKLSYNCTTDYDKNCTTPISEKYSENPQWITYTAVFGSLIITSLIVMLICYCLRKINVYNNLTEVLPGPVVKYSGVLKHGNIFKTS